MNDISKAAVTAYMAIREIIWGLPTMALILGTGTLLSLFCGFPQFTRLRLALKSTIGRAFQTKSVKSGSVSPFKALCTALAASSGTGNIAGVSGAIALGGPGAIFWMWVSALVGMCIKFAEVTLAITYRQRNASGDWVGGPMYYITNGLGPNWKWLASLFALFGGLASFGIGNMTQINTIAHAINETLSHFISTTPQQQRSLSLMVGVVCAVLVFLVLVGGIRRIGDVCALLVPAMSAFYILAALVVICSKIHQLPQILQWIITGAFHPEAVAGGLAGMEIKNVIIHGVGRGIFSNEAGLGSSSIAHAAADVEHPIMQGLFGIFEVFADTIVVCTMTAFVILLGVGADRIPYGTDVGAALTLQGFQSVFPGQISNVVITLALILFALSTLLTWGLYGTRCWEFLLGEKAGKIYQIIFTAFVIIGATMRLDLAWSIADTMNGLMAFPNLIALLLLAPVFVKQYRNYF